MRRIALVALGLLLTVIGTPPAAAQVPAADSWRVTVAPYFMGAAMTGTSAVAGSEVTVDVPFSEILENLQFGAMGLLVARKGNWGVGGDAIWMALGANGTTPLPSVTGTVDFNQGAFAVYGLRRLGSGADLTFGARLNTLQAKIRFNGPGQVRGEATKNWVDPMVGLQLRTPENGGRWHAQLYSEIGGFGVGSTFAWQIFPTFGVNLTRSASLELGYRWLDMDYETGENLALFKYDVLTQGPIMGFAFRF